ncbi:MAG: V-type ATP synthase subunit D [Candidatus Omnitrophota bacterium]
MVKIRLTKNELKKQKDALKRYDQFLPTLILKKQQLQSELIKIRRDMEKIKKEKAYVKAEIYRWVDVFSEEVSEEGLVEVKEIITLLGNIAGIDIPLFKEVEFEDRSYDLMLTPLWVDKGVGALKKTITMNAEQAVLKEQERLVKEELRITTQRVNLFEKVMIPRTKENIRKIQIYLGDLRTAAVVTGKIAKGKILNAA